MRVLLGFQLDALSKTFGDGNPTGFEQCCPRVFRSRRLTLCRLRGLARRPRTLCKTVGVLFGSGTGLGRARAPAIPLVRRHRRRLALRAAWLRVRRHSERCVQVRGGSARVAGEQLGQRLAFTRNLRVAQHQSTTLQSNGELGTSPCVSSRTNTLRLAVLRGL